MRVAEFLRLFPLRAPNIMWLFGAGTSAAARIPTAGHMILDFKRALYCTERKLSPKSLGDLGDEGARRRLQEYFDSKGGFPSEDADDEYAFYFETAYPHEMDRRKYIEQQLTAASPSFGHHALAILLKYGKTRVLWTTNFDRMIEDAAAAAFKSTANLMVATLDNAVLASQALSEERFPLLVKLHGDFQSRRLKNAPAELARQDADFRRSLVDASGKHGLAVLGYSGRDQSIMEALREAIKKGHAFPSGLFWCHRSDSPPLAGVTQLLDYARSNGVQAEAIEIETFDELMGDLVRQCAEISDDVLSMLSARTARATDALIAPRGKGWPVVRLNALPLLQFPTSCRRVVCGIGGAKDVREAIASAGVDVIGARRNVGVLAFGSDKAVRATFDRFGITMFDLHALETKRLKWESAELGLLYDALCLGIARSRPLKLSRSRRDHRLLVDPGQAKDPRLAGLKSIAGAVTGKLAGGAVEWAEAVRVRLEYRFDSLWLVLEPTIWCSSTPDRPRTPEVGEFVRERKARRYNRDWGKLIDAWVDVVAGASDAAEFRAFGLGDGVDAVFTVGRVTAFSRRAV